MVKVQVYSVKGTKVGEIALPKDIFEAEVNMDLLSQANYVYQERSHVGLRNTKTRSEVNRTTKKVYKQKGTGGARHGSRRANLYVGGGITFGPRPLRREIDMSKSQKRSALISAFSARAKAGDIVAVKGMKEVKKTNEFGAFIKKLGEEVKSKRFTFIVSDENTAASRFLRNLKNVDYVFYKNVNAFDVIGAGEVVLDESIFAEKKVKSEKVTKSEEVAKKGKVDK